ncbi:hypothetical protein EYV94_22130 [Puteibacter caeruleilacunae]|nr:hypothetical protein EYV94_22130 [Puteibacter caeruleilacunae]
MEWIKLLLVVVGMLAFAVVGLATQILLKKNGQFPDTHVGHNKDMKKLGLTCAKGFDKMEQKKGWEKYRLKNLKLAK